MIKKLSLALLSLACCGAVGAQTFHNEISLPATQYLMKGVDNEFYTQTFLKQWRPYTDFVRYSGSAGYATSGRLEKKAIIDNPQDGQTIKVDLVNFDEYKTLNSITSTIKAAEPGVGQEQVRVQFLGDSYTSGLYFKSAFLESGYVPNVQLIGVRKVAGYQGQCHEGRGGWTLARYFSTDTSSDIFCNPYYQPEGEYRYWGNTAFWQNAVKLASGAEINDKNIVYFCSNYSTERFALDGRLKNPQTNDLMYDSDKDCFVVWNGRGWRRIDKPAKWNFDYSKYLDMWELDAPEFLVVMLGLNDFRHKDFPLDFDSWNAKMERLIASYHKAVPQGRFALCTPCTSCGTLNNATNQFTTLQNAKMWQARKNVIDNFDGRESERVYVVDASVTIDNENGYRMVDGVQTGSPHPYLNYPALAVPIAAFVQYYRDK